jgi:hypothetical protein
MTQVSAMSCQEAAKQGMECHLTDGGPLAVRVTLQTFRDALKGAGMSCEPTQDAPERIALIPLEGSAKKFETLDCAAAMERPRSGTQSSHSRQRRLHRDFARVGVPAAQRQLRASSGA